MTEDQPGLGFGTRLELMYRNTHEVVDATALLAGQSNVKVRMRSVQPGWDWWWAS